jgi:hypothetical protein
MDKCKSCGAEIMWIKTENLKASPLSVKSKIKRWVVPAEFSQGWESGVAIQVDTYVSHFADCPDAAQHRKPKDA